MFCFNLLTIYVNFFKIINFFTKRIYILFYFEITLLRFQDYESKLPNLNQVKTDYDSLKSAFDAAHKQLEEQNLDENQNDNENKFTLAQQKEMLELQEKIQYLLMRQYFISPSFQPIVSEMFLRDDFSFHYYLTLVIKKGICQVFRMTISTLILITFCIGFWALIYWLCKSSIQLIIMFFIPFLIAILLLVKLFITQKIFNNLIHVVDSQFDFQFQQFDRTRQPLINCGKVNVPEFLKEPNKNLDQNLANSERQCINKHEALYWLGSPKFHIKILHFCFICQTLWIIVFFFQYFKNFDVSEYIIFGFVCLIILFSLFYLLPQNLYYVLISSKIQLLRDRKLIIKTILKQKQKRISLFFRLYQLLKHTRKLHTHLKVPNLSLPIQKQLNEFFKLYELKYQDFPFQGLKMICHQCGNNLTEEDFLLLITDACQQLDQSEQQIQDGEEQLIIEPKYTLTLPLLKTTVGIKMQEIKYEPANETTQILKKLLKQISKFGEDESYQQMNDQDPNKDDLVTLRQMEQILNDIFGDEHAEDIDNIIFEIRYLQTKQHSIYFDVAFIGNLLRNYIEGLPR